MSEQRMVYVLMFCDGDRIDPRSVHASLAHAQAAVSEPGAWRHDEGTLLWDLVAPHERELPLIGWTIVAYPLQGEATP